MKAIEVINGNIHCSKCDQTKSIDQFYWFNGKPKRPCKECKLGYQHEVYREANPEIQRTPSELSRVEYQKQYRQDHKQQLRQQEQTYRANRSINDPSYKLRYVVSNSIFQALKYEGSTKGGKSVWNHLPYTPDELRANIESKFEPWMNWNNWGSYIPNQWNDNDQTTWMWHLDHKIPQSQLIYCTMDETNFQLCWALDNLRPYSAKQNVIDGNRKNRKQ